MKCFSGQNYWVWIVHSGLSKFFFSVCIFMHAFSHSMSRIGHTNWRSLLPLSLIPYSWYTKNWIPNEALSFSVMSSSPIFYLNSQEKKKKKKKVSMRKVLYERGDRVVTRRHLQIQLEKCRGWNAWSMSTEMKAVLVGQPSFAFFKRFSFFIFHFLPHFHWFGKGRCMGEQRENERKRVISVD